MATQTDGSAKLAEGPPPPGAPRRGPGPRLLAVAAVVGLAVAGGVGAYLVNAGHESTDDAQVEADVVPLSVRTSGQVIRTLVRENQAVKAGDILFHLDPNDQLARVHGAEAELANARAQLAHAEADVLVVEAGARGGLKTAEANLSGSALGVHTAAAQVTSARAALERARAQQRRAQVDLERAKTLRAANAVTQEYLDHMQATFDAGQAEVEQMQAQHAVAREAREQALSRVTEAEGRLGQSRPIEAQIAAAHAAVDLARAGVQAAVSRLDLQRLQFDYLKVTAPVDGTLSRLAAHEGQLLQSGQAVGELVPPASYVVANFKETQIAHMRPGQLALVRVDALGGRELHARVESISAGTGARFSLLPPDNATGNFVKVVQRVPVRLGWLEPPEGTGLRAGLSVDVRVYTRD